MKNETAWYNQPNLLDLLLFTLPPLGLYGLYKCDKMRGTVKKLLYGILGLLSQLLLVINLTS